MAVTKDGKVELVKETESKIGMGKAVSYGEVQKLKWQYIKHNMEYWEGRKAVSLDGKLK